ncbi:MAG: type VI secretion system contractile sheath protein TssC [Bacteroidia bacterium]
MFNYGIGGQEMHKDASETLADLPQNRTLIIIGLTSEQPLKPEIVHGLKTTEEVFNYYHPQLNVEFLNEDGSTFTEVISFHSLSDFGLKGLFNQSNFLINLKNQVNEHAIVIKQLKTNRLLRACIENSLNKESLFSALLALVQEIECANNIALKEKMNDLAQVLQDSIDKLAKLGGYDFLESIIEGAGNLNPERKARKKIFLTESAYEQEREFLKIKLKHWAEMLKEIDDISKFIETSLIKSDGANKLLNKNLLKVLNATRELETTYKAVALFFKNTESDKVKNVTFVNAGLDQLKDLDNLQFSNAIAEELSQNIRRYDMRDNYSILIIPGYLGSDKALEKWGKIAHENKVMLITDFDNLDTPEDIFDEFEKANLTGEEIYRSNISMTCNWLIGRVGNLDVGENDDLYIPPSTAFGGKLYIVIMSMVTAGKRHGGLNEVDGVKFDLKKSEIANLEKLGLVTMVSEYGKVMAFSNRTLYNGDNLALQSFSVVRTFDYIIKVLIGFLHIRAFENFTSKSENEFRNEIIKFLDGRIGPNRLIEQFKILRFEPDPYQNFRFYLDINMIPYFPAKSFVIKMDFQMSHDGNEVQWSTEYTKG